MICTTHLFANTHPDGTITLLRKCQKIKIEQTRLVLFVKMDVKVIKARKKEMKLHDMVTWQKICW